MRAVFFFCRMQIAYSARKYILNIYYRLEFSRARNVCGGMLFCISIGFAIDFSV